MPRTDVETGISLIPQPTDGRPIPAITLIAAPGVVDNLFREMAKPAVPCPITPMCGLIFNCE